MPAKRPPLGQHFLRHPEIAQKIVSCLGEGPLGTVGEIGPGRGILTEALWLKSQRLVLIERDLRLVDRLKERFEPLGVQIIQGDAREVCMGSIVGEGEEAYVISNLPFYAQAPILMTLLNQSDRIRRMVLMFQKEVADRILATPSSKAYGLLSVFSQLSARIEKGIFVPRGAFSPAPKVDARVLIFEPYPCPVVSPGDPRFFSFLLRQLFQSRRKTLRTTLRRLGYERGIKDLAGFQEDLSKRPEELSPTRLVELADALGSFKKDSERLK
jgi:16S rRNA (adenine1518-N6/adenine1519-N6)-dimethyltransferase